MSIKEGIMKEGIPISLRTTVQKNIQGIISFTIERGKKEYQRAQHHSAQDELGIRLVTQTGEHPFTSTHHPDKIQAYDAAEDTQDDACRYSFDLDEHRRASGARQKC